MEIIQINSSDNGLFQAIDNGDITGEMFYTWDGNDKIIITHTEVNEAFNGKGIGKKMVLEAVNFARQNNIKIIPVCPFAKKVFDKVDEIKDVLGNH